MTSIANLAALLRPVRDVPGDFAEFGVWRGDTFRPLARAATEIGRTAHAFDSFIGMNDPGPYDHDPDGPAYPKGKFSVGGAERFRRYMPAGVKYQLWAGYIPDCLRGAENLVLSFAFVDLDHYGPTKDALGFAWAHMSVGAILLCDDWFEGRPILAARAIGEFRAETQAEASSRLAGPNQLWLRKGD